MTIEVSGGIYIDYGCSGIVRISKGVFIPTDSQTSDSEAEFQKDLKAFLEKWFTRQTYHESTGCVLRKLWPIPSGFILNPDNNNVVITVNASFQCLV